MDDEGSKTTTSDEQCECEMSCAKFLLDLKSQKPKFVRSMIEAGLLSQEMEMCLIREPHSEFMMKGLHGLSGGFVSLDASKPWICYWILHALYLLREEANFMFDNVISTLSHMQAPDGGYGGGPGQIPHCAATYASVLTLCTTRKKEALQSIDREGMYRFFLSCKDASGGFAMHDAGEVDSRASYTVLAIARVLNILTPELVSGTAEYLLACQTYEGGFGGEPGNEAHGGYNFCAVAALLILGQAHRMKVSTQKHWLAHRQTRLEGGFQGRTNKLVDSCYSFWQGAAMAMVHVIERGGNDLSDVEAMRSLFEDGEDDGEVQGEDDVDMVLESSSIRHVKAVSGTNGPMDYNQEALQRYILHCAQTSEGGLRDKPGKGRDYYHSCYSLSGLSVCQNFPFALALDSSSAPTAYVYGDADNLLEPTSIVFNIGPAALDEAILHFSKLPSSHAALLQH